MKPSKSLRKQPAFPGNHMNRLSRQEQEFSSFITSEVKAGSSIELACGSFAGKNGITYAEAYNWYQKITAKLHNNKFTNGETEIKDLMDTYLNEVISAEALHVMNDAVLCSLYAGDKRLPFDGFLSLSEISVNYINDINDYVKVGDIFKVTMIDYPKEGESRVIISSVATKSLNPQYAKRDAINLIATPAVVRLHKIKEYIEEINILIDQVLTEMKEYDELKSVTDQLQKILSKKGEL